MADELEVVMSVDDQTAEGLKESISNIQSGVDKINSVVNKGMSSTMNNAERIMRTRTGSIMMLMTRLTARIVSQFDDANSKVVASFYKYEDGANIAKNALGDLALSGGAGLNELSKNLSTINQQVGHLFGKGYGKQAEQVMTALTSSTTKLSHDTGVSVKSMADGFQVFLSAGLDTQQAMDLVTKTVLSGNGQILDSFMKIGQESPGAIESVTQKWIEQMGGIQAVNGATDEYMNKTRTFSENMASLWATTQVALQPLMESLNRISSFLLPYIQEGLMWIKAILDLIPDWAKDLGMMVLLMSTLGNVINFVTSQFSGFGGILGSVKNGFLGLGKVALFPFQLMGKGIAFAGKGFGFLLGTAKTAIGGVTGLSMLAGGKILLIGGAAVAAGVVLFKAFQPFHDLISSIINRIKTMLGLLGKKVSGAVSAMGGGKKGGGIKTPTMPKMKPMGGRRPPVRNLTPIKPKKSGGGGAKPKKTPKPKVDKTREKQLKAQKKAADRAEKIERDLSKRLKDEFERRKQAYMNFVGFFEGVNRKVIGISNIIKNLESQKQALADYTEAIKILQTRLGDSEPAQQFIAELEKLGPGSVDQIQALAFASDEELAHVVSLFQDKSALATNKAGEEVARLEPIFRKEVEDANKAGDQKFDEGGKKMDNTLNKGMGKLDGTLDKGLLNMDGTMGDGWNDLNTTTGGGVGDVNTTANNGFTDMFKGMTEKMNGFKKKWNEYWKEHGLGEGIILGFGYLIGLVTGWCARLLKAIDEHILQPGLKKTGDDLIGGLWEGIKGAWGWLKKAVSGFCDMVVKGFNKGFDVHSPSKRTKKTGRFVMMGLGVGMDQGYDKYVNGLSEVYANKVMDGYDMILKEAEATYQEDIGGLNHSLSKNTMYTKGLTINVENMNCRDKKDIESISRQLFELERANTRIYGGMGNG